MKICVYEEVDNAVLKWMTCIRNNNLPISEIWFYRFSCKLWTEIIETDIEILDVQREWRLVHCDGVTLQDYLKIDEDIAVYESPTKENIVEEVRKKEKPDEFEEEDDEEEHLVEQSKLTEEDILNALSVVRNGFRQEANVPEEIF
ncbi:Hypothetical protein CINCED_3A023275 [Cinara cedri]|uniref:Uncharacterized protein n=1 Tax=Cinara cedri TaxID=506608 RepID=A0A5E4MFA3_9HEMI|nr:Hypothetical protein CINCED_3A023275 [Cinara cedri]